jgi:hypothetical protein
MKDPAVALTPEAIIVWPHLFEPTSFNDSEEYYRALLLFEKDVDFSTLHAAVRAAALKKFSAINDEDFKNLRKPIRRGSEKAVDKTGGIDKESFYFNRYFINAKSKFQPQIVDIYNAPITDETAIYGGCIVRAYLSFFGYDFAGNLGVSCSLRALIKIDDGDPLGGGKIDTGAAFAGVIKERPTAFDTEELDDDIRF